LDVNNKGSSVHADVYMCCSSGARWECCHEICQLPL